MALWRLTVQRNGIDRSRVLRRSAGDVERAGQDLFTEARGIPVGGFVKSTFWWHLTHHVDDGVVELGPRGSEYFQLRFGNPTRWNVRPQGRSFRGTGGISKEIRNSNPAI
jgi:hypothetical protein